MTAETERDGSSTVEEALQASRDPSIFSRLLEEVKRTVDKLGRKAVLMEVCGSHTWAISHTGIRDLLKDSVDLISGPGCPVCVTSAGEIARMVDLAKTRGVMTATFGDMLRVPGPKGSLEAARAEGHRIQVVYSAWDAIELAKANPTAEVVFLGVGFETTAPSAAVLVRACKEQGIRNLSLYSAHKTMPQALRSLLGAPDFAVDGLILPGHVSAVTGWRYFDFVGTEFGVPAAVSGFEACDILYAVLVILKKLVSGDHSISNCYQRAVSADGNVRAMAAIREVFETKASLWRGLGWVSDSGLEVSSNLKEFDAVSRFGLGPVSDEPEPPGCGCAKVLTGRVKPHDCPLFGIACNPSRPVGPCMVSSEGSCRAYYSYEGRRDGGF